MFLYRFSEKNHMYLEFPFYVFLCNSYRKISKIKAEMNSKIKRRFVKHAKVFIVTNDFFKYISLEVTLSPLNITSMILLKKCLRLN